MVYYGPGRSGKTTNLVQLHQRSDAQARTSLVGVDTEAERSVYFEYFAAALGSVSGYRLRAEFYTVPGRAYFTSTRRLALDHVDGVVLVLDSSPQRWRANVQSLEDLREDLASGARSTMSRSWCSSTSRISPTRLMPSAWPGTSRSVAVRRCRPSPRVGWASKPRATPS